MAKFMAKTVAIGVLDLSMKKFYLDRNFLERCPTLDSTDA